MLFKYALAGLLVLMPLALNAKPAQAEVMKIVRPNDPNSPKSSTMKFQANPQTQAIDAVRNDLNTAKAQIDTAGQKIQELNDKIENLTQTIYAQGREIINLRRAVDQAQTQTGQVMNCNAQGKFFNGSRCANFDK